MCNGRLTLESGVPISTSDQTGKTTIYWTPYKGAQIALYSGSVWEVLSFSETSIALGTLTSGKNYDVFAYNNSGTLALEFSSAWTSDTARADALTLQDGVYVKSGATTRRYLGTFRTTSTTETEDSGGGSTTQVGGKRFVWNYYNRVPRNISVKDTASTWSYATGTWRQANSAAGNKVEVVVGISENAVDLTLTVGLASISVSARAAQSGIGLDSTSAAPPKLFGMGFFNYSTGGGQTITSTYRETLSAGYHYLTWMEYGSDGTCTWYGSSFGQSGMNGVVWA